MRQWKGDSGVCRPAVAARAWVQACVGLAASICSSYAVGQQWYLESGFASQLSWSSNTDFGVSSGKEDLVLDLHPHLTLRREGARLSVVGTAALSGVATANHTQTSRILPQADLSARWEAIERLLFLDAGYRAAQTGADPFGARPVGGLTSSNTVTTSQTRLSPFISASVGADTRYSLRSDNTWTKEIGARIPTSGAGGYYGRQAVAVEHDPQPFGWRLEAERSQTRYDDPALERLTSDLARASLSYALMEDFSAGIRAGYERTSFLDTEGHRIYGVEARWQPSPRTLFSGYRERRFFGSGWRVGFEHRRPQIAWTMALTRGFDTTPQSVFELPPTDNVAALVNEMFTTRYPDPVERQRVVQDYISRQGLPSSTLLPTTLFSERLSVVTTRSASVALIGARNSLALSGFHTRTEDALDTGPFATGVAATNNIRYGASAVLSHRLSTNSAVTLGLDWSRVRALGSVAAEESTEHGASLRVSVTASPKTSAYFGGRYRKLDSNVVIDGQEGSVFVGMDHRF